MAQLKFPLFLSKLSIRAVNVLLSAAHVSMFGKIVISFIHEFLFPYRMTEPKNIFIIDHFHHKNIKNTFFEM